MNTKYTAVRDHWYIQNGNQYHDAGYKYVDMLPEDNGSTDAMLDRIGIKSDVIALFEGHLKSVV